jgi:alkylated DNA repair dioxygenase AlkB
VDFDCSKMTTITFKTLRTKLLQEVATNNNKPKNTNSTNDNKPNNKQCDDITILPPIAISKTLFALYLYEIPTPNHQPGLFLIPNFVTENEAEILQTNIKHYPFKTLHYRRLQVWGGDPIPGAREPLPNWLLPLTSSLETLGIVNFEINHCLINEYQPEPHSGILPHTDGPMYIDKTVCLSLGNGCADFVFTPRRVSHDEIHSLEVEPIFSITLPSRSLVVFTGFWYNNVLHSIENVRDGERLSLTLRNIKS